MVSNHPLTSIPTEIGQMTGLTWMVLTDGSIKEVPTEIGYLSSLKKLFFGSSFKIKNLDAIFSEHLHGNLIEALPTEIGLLDKVTDMQIYKNLLSTLPTEVGLLTSLSCV